MRKASTLVGLTLMALAAGARAEDAVPAPPPSPSAPPAGVDPFPAAVPSPSAPPPAPVGTVGMVAPVAPEEPPPKRIEVGLSFLPMGRGKLTTPSGATDVSGDARLAYGVGLSATYHVIAGLHLGVAPQALFNVNYKVNPAGNGIALPASSTEYDLMARVQYAFPLVDGITLYGEFLPGYSRLSHPGASTSKGLVFALGGGAAMDMSDRIFIDLGVGYQVGYQSLNVQGMIRDSRSQFLRVALGVGTRF
jgi:Outer membrane protein beta-barrel domain